MHSAQLAKQADDRRQQELNRDKNIMAVSDEQRNQDIGSDLSQDMGQDMGQELEGTSDELPSRGRNIGESSYARIDSLEEESDPELIAAIMNRGQAPKQGDGNPNGPVVMDSTSKPKAAKNTDIMALAKEMEKGR